MKNDRALFVLWHLQKTLVDDYFISISGRLEEMLIYSDGKTKILIIDRVGNFKSKDDDDIDDC